MNYFAYGSNMLMARIQERVPSAKPLGTAELTRHRLVWHKRSTDGSAKCDIVETGKEEDRVHGVLYELDPYEKPELDRAEGLGCGYDQKCVNVKHDGHVKKAITYYVPHVDKRLKPYHWYKEFVVAGAKEHHLPEEYVAALEATESVQDPDSKRRAKNEKLLKGSQQGAAEVRPPAEAAMDDVVRDAVRRAFERLVAQDGSLFDCPIEGDVTYDARKLHEVCINHHLANYLQEEMLPVLRDGSDLFVDIEFNREGPRPKNADGDGVCQLVRPDIIVHNRKSDDAKKNLLVVECKKSDASTADRETDCQKVRALMEDDRYKYAYGLQAIYGRGTVAGMFFYRDGRRIVSEPIN